MDTETLNKPVNLHNLSLAIAKTQADYTRIIDSTASELVAINQGSDNAGKVLSVNNNGRVEATSPTQSDWTQDTETDSSYILNRPAIRAGEGENSISVGQLEQDEKAATYTIYITADANTTTCSFTSNDTFPSSLNAKSCLLYRPSAAIKYLYIEAIDLTNKTITFLSTLGQSAISSEEAILYYHYKIVHGDYSLAEGNGTGAIGKYSHAEGWDTKAIGGASHAEGYRSSANNMGAHAEGAGIADGMYSHAEGMHTIADGMYSHTEGYYTIATGSYSHAQGRYNIEDTEKIYADIVGNGASSSARSNAYTLDWNGNGWFAGKVSAGTTETPATPANANDLTTKQYVDNAIAEVSGIQSDWDESDSTKSSYVLNRPLWLDKYSSPVISDQTIELNKDNPEIFYYIGDGVLYNYRYEFLSINGMLSQSSGDVATVTFDGVEYKGYLNIIIGDDGSYEFSYQDTQHPPISIKLSKNSITLQLNIVSSSSLSGVFSLTLPYAEARYDSKYSSIFESTVHYIPVTLNDDGSCTSDVNLNYIYNLLDKHCNVILQVNTGDANYPLFLYLTNCNDAPGLEFTGFDHNLRWICLWTASKITLTSVSTITIKTWTASDITG